MMAEPIAPPPSPEKQSQTRPRSKRAASDRVEKASALMAKWSTIAETKRKQAEKAETKGDHLKAAKLREAVRKALALALRQAKKIERLEPLVPIQAANAKFAEVLGRRLTGLTRTQNRWKREREQDRRAARRAGARTRLETVASAYGSGYGFDKLQRVTDTVASLRRRRLIGERELQAAEKYRDAYMAINGGITGTLNPDKMGTGSAATRTPGDEALWAAEVLNEADQLLGKLDGEVVKQVVGEGLTLEEYARRRSGTARAPQWQIRLVGARLKESLKALADRWFPMRKQRMRTHRAPDAKPTVMGDAFRAEIEPGRVAHASRQGVEFSERKDEGEE